jgi:hypothetical protein
VDFVKTEIEQLEKALNAIIHRPQLIRREYWISQIESLLKRSKLSPHDQQRLVALLELLGTSPAEFSSACQ